MTRLEIWIVTPGIVLATIVAQGCESPVIDYGYQLEGVVSDSQTLQPISLVEVSLGFDDSRPFQQLMLTGDDGRYFYEALGPMRPSSERFRFVKQGYRTREVLGAEAIREAAVPYRLDVLLEPE